MNINKKRENFKSERERERKRALSFVSNYYLVREVAPNAPK